MDPSQAPPPWWQSSHQAPRFDPWMDFLWGDPAHHWSSHASSLWGDVALAWSLIFRYARGREARWRKRER